VSSHREPFIDWLSPGVVVVGTLSFYVGGRLLIRHYLHLPLLWGGTGEAEHRALLLCALFLSAVLFGAAVSPSRPGWQITIARRSSVADAVGTLVALVYVTVGLAAISILIQRLGGLDAALRGQIGWAAEIRERGLGPLYGLFFLYVIGWMVLAFRALDARRPLMGGLAYAVAVLPALILGRRVVLLFAALPLVIVVHYHYRRLKLRELVPIGVLAFALLTALLAWRLRLDGPVPEALAASREYALFDALVAAVDRAEYLRSSLTPSHFLRHPRDLLDTNTGALFMERLAGFRYQGGATPPSAVGTLWVYFSYPGVALGGFLLGLILGRTRVQALQSPPLALLHGMLLFYAFDFVRNGDIVVGLKLATRYVTPMMLLLLVFYRFQAQYARPVRHSAFTERP
jgi:hypothetical protein